LVCGGAYGRAPAPPMPEGAGPKVAASERDVDVEPAVADARIAERLRGLLTATERFDEIRVEARQGVVFLEGTAVDDSAVELAGELAARTDGVAAVVNELSVRATPVWSLEPAREELGRLGREALRSAPRLLLGLAALLLFVLAGLVAARGADAVVARRAPGPLLRGVVRQAVVLIAVLMGLYVGLRLSGLTRVALTVASGAGLLGLALGFAFRDIAENFLAGLLLSTQRPFRIGDVIEVGEHVGVARKVTSRGTLLIDFDGNHIQLANSTVYKSTIKNYSANPLVRIHFGVGIGYDADIEHAQAEVLGALERHPAVLSDPQPLVLAESLGAATVNLRVYAWIDGSEHSMLRVKSALLRLALTTLEAAGVSMPDEAREVIFPEGVPVREMAALEGAGAERAGSGRSPEAGAAGGGVGGASERAVGRAGGGAADHAVVAAEGGLASETEEIRRQADRSRDPGEPERPEPERSGGWR